MSKIRSPQKVDEVRRMLVATGATAAVALPLSLTGCTAQSPPTKDKTDADRAQATWRQTMGTITVKDGTQIYYKDWGSGPAVMLSHGWPLSSDSWESLMFFLATEGYRVVAHDRRGHGRSSQPSGGNEMDTYADDLAAVFEHLSINEATLIGFSTGGGEVARYIGRHGTKRLKKAGLVSAIPPLMLKSDTNPNGVPIEVFDGIRRSQLEDRSQFYRDLPSGPFYGFNRSGSKPSQGLIDFWWLQGMAAGHKNTYECIKAFSETDFTEDLKKFNVPTLIIHGSDDQIVPIDTSARASNKMIVGSTLIVYENAPHGLTDTHKDRFHADILAFLKA